MAFTEAQLLTAIQDSGADVQAQIVRFIPGPLFTDVYIQNMLDSRAHTGAWVQVDSTLTAANAHIAIDAALA